MDDEEAYDFCYELLQADQRSTATPETGGYKLMEDLGASEHPLDKAMRTNDLALRCYYVEHGEKAAKRDWHGLSAASRALYKRLPIVAGTGLASGSYFFRTYTNKVQPITERMSGDHPMFAYQAS